MRNDDRAGEEKIRRYVRYRKKRSGSKRKSAKKRASFRGRGRATA